MPSYAGAFPTVCVLHFYFYFYFYIPFSLLLFRFGTLENRIRVYIFLRYKNDCRCAMCWNWWTCDLQVEWFRKSFDLFLCVYVSICTIVCLKTKRAFSRSTAMMTFAIVLFVVALPILLSLFPSSIPYDTRTLCVLLLGIACCCCCKNTNCW